jgi:hypothetical protein
MKQSSYHEALAKCERDGMKLAVLDGKEEMKNVMEYLSYTGKRFLMQRSFVIMGGKTRLDFATKVRANQSMSSNYALCNYNFSSKL